ncbi:MAG: A/G-specific adenine glycosylase [Chitinophagaceae bacterium]|nr:A/G-specific adenine glycosylase [Chitinophagaceae bacterium]
MIPKNKYFTAKLLSWNKNQNRRQMPWKGEKDPYKIWLSEIILQQTRVEQGWAYYNRFIRAFPNIEKLANAPEEKIFKLWEGLGYYTRCKNLIATAKIIEKRDGGIFPDNYNDILALKGIGPYTAAAIASFAFNLPYAVVDGNVFRVLSRFFGMEEPIDSAVGKKIFTSLATKLLDKRLPGIYNQAIMDFGATVCKPKNPLCSNCLLSHQCAAVLQNKIDKLPVKSGKPAKKTRLFYYFIIDYKGKVYVKKRGPNDIWENLHEFALAETTQPVPVKQLKSGDIVKQLIGVNQVDVLTVSAINRQQLTHQTILGRFIQCSINQSISIKGYKAISYKQLQKLAFPKFITGYLAKNELLAFAG